MIRLMIFMAIAYYVYKNIKNWKIFDVLSGSGKDSKEIDDLMVQDPYCKVYFPKKDGVHLKHNGEDLYFCSKECRDKFLKS